MNDRNPHILKTWLAKAAAVGEDVPRPCLTYIYAFRENGAWVMMSADKYRMHLAHHFPSRLKADAEKEGDAYVIELPDSVTDDKGVSKWVQKLPENVTPITRPVIEEYEAKILVNPAELMQVVKWIHTRQDFEGIMLSTNGMNLDIWGTDIIRTRTVPMDACQGDFTMMVNSQYLLDALWIHYYEPQATLRIAKKNTMLGVGDPDGNFAVVMAMAGAIITRPNKVRTTILISVDDGEEVELEF